MIVQDTNVRTNYMTTYVSYRRAHGPLIIIPLHMHGQRNCNGHLHMQVYECEPQLNRLELTLRHPICAMASYLKTELLRLKYSRALLESTTGKGQFFYESSV